MSSNDLQPPTFTPGLFEGGFEPYVRAVRRHRLLVALVTLACVVGAGIWLALRTPQYQATSNVVVTPMPFDDSTFDGLAVLRDTPGDPTRAAQTGAALIETPAAAGAAAQALGPGWTAGRVAAAVTVTPRGGTNILAVQARAGTRAEAVAVAQAYSAAALEQRRQALAQGATGLLAQIKASPDPPPDKVAALLPLTQGFDPTFSLLQPTPSAATVAGRPLWRMLASALVAGFVLAVGAALVSDGILRRRRAGAPTAVDDSEPEQDTVHRLAAGADWGPS